MGEEVLRAIAEGTRMLLIRRIGKSNRGVCACELPRFAKVSQPAVSQHLKVLKEAKLVMMRRDGVKRIYSLSEKGRKVLRDIEGW